VRFLLILFGLIMIYRLLRALVEKPPGQPGRRDVGGRRNNKPLDLRGKDVEDARFEDIDEKKAPQ
jgi:hypothetical protein